jgi:hypothetical protein
MCSSSGFWDGSIFFLSQLTSFFMFSSYLVGELHNFGITYTPVAPPYAAGIGGMFSAA